MKKDDIEKLKRLSDANEQNELVVFIGAGVSVNSGYPSWKKIITIMGQEINYIDPDKDENEVHLDSSDYLKIPEIMYFRDKEKYNQILLKYLKLDNEPNKINDLISKLRPDQIITTNYDDLIEKSLLNNGLDESYGVVYDDKTFMEQGKRKNHFVIKMHGDINDLDSMVLKEKDYLDFESNKPMISNFINNLLSTHIFLFVGYSLSDNTLKMIINKISNFRKKLNVTGLPKNIMAGFFDDDKYNYNLENNYYSQRDVELFNLDGFKIYGEDEKRKKLEYFMNIINEFNTEGILAEYSNQNYISYNEINNCIKHISDDIHVEDNVEDVNVIDNSAVYKSFFNDNDDNLKQLVLNKTMDYKVSKRGTNKIKTIKSGIDDSVYNMIIHCKYDELYDYYISNKDVMNVNEYYFLNSMMKDQFKPIKMHSNLNDDKGLINRMILSNNKEYFGIQDDYLQLSPNQKSVTNFVRRVVEGRVINNVEYKKLYEQSRHEYGQDVDFYFSMDGNNFYDNKYGMLRYSRKVSYDLYRYMNINRIINESQNINVYKLFLNCILLTYHQVKDTDHFMKYANYYKLTALDIDIIVKNINFTDIIDIFNKNELEYLKIDNVHDVVNALVNLCKSYNYLRNKKIRNNLNHQILEYIKSYIIFLSLDNSLNNLDLERIYDSIYSLKNTVYQRDLFSVFENNFLSRLNTNDYIDFNANKILIDKLVNVDIFKKIMPDYEEPAFKNIRKIIKHYESSIKDVKNNLDNYDVDTNYLSLFLPVVYSRKEMQSKSEWIINSFKNDPLLLVFLMCDEDLLKNKVNEILELVIKTCYKPNQESMGYTFYNMLAFLGLKSLGANVNMPDELAKSRKDKVKLNRIVSFVLDDESFDFKNIDLTYDIWQMALLDDIRYKRFRLVSILKPHLDEIISDNIISSFKRGTLSQREMIVLNGLGVTLDDLYKY